MGNEGVCPKVGEARVPATAWTPNSEIATPTPASRPAGDPGAAVFCWIILALLLALFLAFTWKYGSFVIWMDDLSFVPYLTGQEPITLSWLWSPHAEHRMPIYKLAWISLVRLFDGELRLLMVINIFSLGGAAALLMLTAQRLRGSASYADGFFALALLNPSNAHGYSYAALIAQVLAVIPVLALVLIVLRSRNRLTLRAGLLAGACLLILPLFGGYGISLVCALSVWLGYAGMCVWWNGGRHSRRDGPILIGTAALALLLLALYFVGYELPGDPQPTPTIETMLRAGMQFFSVSLGVATAPYWLCFGIAVVGLLAATCAGVVVIWVLRAGERVRAIGFLLFILGLVGLAPVVAMRRPDHGGNDAHYQFFIFPALFCAYFSAQLYAWPGLARFVQMSLFITACVLIVPNIETGVARAEGVRQQAAAFETDLLAGKPPFILVEYHTPFLLPFPQGEAFVAYVLPSLKRAGIGRYREMRDDPHYQEVAVQIPSSLAQVEPRPGGNFGSDHDLVIDLPAPRFVYAVRFRCSYGNAQTVPVVFQAIWWNTQQIAAGGTGGHTLLPLGLHYSRPVESILEDKVITVWVNDTIDQVRIQPNLSPCSFGIREIALLAPVDKPAMPEQ
jgi:hypothetical protein